MKLHWIEHLDAESEVVRVLCHADRYVARVAPHRDRSWRVEVRRREAWGPTWSPLRGNPRGRYKVRPVRFWRSPQAAMRVAETLFTSVSEEKKP